LARNVWLLTSQHHEAWEKGLVSTPWPTCVAGFQTWRQLGRSVDRGQRGYQILAPNRHLRRVAVDEGGNARTLVDDEPVEVGERIEKQQVIRGFRIEHSWDVAQTSGDPLPEPPTPRLLHGEAPAGLWDTVAAQLHDRGYSVRLVGSAADLQGANGRVTWASRLVEVRADMDEASRCKSLLHEAAHCLLHDPAAPEPKVGRRPPGRGAREVEAESVAFIVADAHGMATDDYTFPYVAVWAGQDGSEVVKNAATRVASAAREIITASPIAHGTGGMVTKLAIQSPIGREDANREPARPSQLPERAPARRNTPGPGLAS
jgi:hypothetical protein